MNDRGIGSSSRRKLCEEEGETRTRAHNEVGLLSAMVVAMGSNSGDDGEADREDGDVARPCISMFIEVLNAQWFGCRRSLSALYNLVVVHEYASVFVLKHSVLIVWQDQARKRRSYTTNGFQTLWTELRANQEASGC